MINPAHAKEHRSLPLSCIQPSNPFEATLYQAWAGCSVDNDKIDYAIELGNVSATFLKTFAHPDIMSSGLQLRHEQSRSGLIKSTYQDARHFSTPLNWRED